MCKSSIDGTQNLYKAITICVAAWVPHTGGGDGQAVSVLNKDNFDFLTDVKSLNQPYAVLT